MPRRQALGCETRSLQTFENNFSSLKTSHWRSPSSPEASKKPNKCKYSCNKANCELRKRLNKGIYSFNKANSRCNR